jgi:hypothetical protein
MIRIVLLPASYVYCIHCHATGIMSGPPQPDDHNLWNPQECFFKPDCPGMVYPEAIN